MPHSSRIAVLHSPGSARWGSCHSIGRNLALAYKIAGKRPKTQIDLLKYQSGLSARQLDSLARIILNGNYSCLSFIDHSPLPFDLVKALMSAAKGRPLPPVLIHVYGDFTFHAPTFLSTIYLLRGQRLRLVCASPKQAGLVSNLVSAPTGAVGCCPFPVDPRQFFPDPALRVAGRRALGWGRDEFVILYSGRLSLQKNVTLMLQEIFRHLGRQRGGRKVRVALAGAYDDLGVPFFGIYPPEEEYFHRTKKLLHNLDRDLGAVDQLGSLDPRRLNRVYNAADALMSLSLHHDEDFGMAPAEALACGLPCLLSDWGGFSGFAGMAHTDRKRVWLVPPRLGERGVVFPGESVDAALQELLAVEDDGSARMTAAQSFLDALSLEAVAEKVLHEVDAVRAAPALEIGQAFISLSERTLGLHRGKRQSVYSGFGDPLYRQVYEAYFLPGTPSVPPGRKGPGGGHALDWFTPLHAVCALARPKVAAEKRLHEMLFPLTAEYSGAVPSVFLHLLRDFRELEREKLTVARDGAIPLVHFFRRHPAPEGISGKIAVQEELLGWVPPAWQPSVVAYRVMSRRPRLESASAAFLFGLNTCGALSVASCASALKRHGRRIAQAGKRYVYLPSRYLSVREPDQPKLEIARRVFAAAGPEAVAVDWNHLPAPRALSRCLVVDLGERLLVADPAPVHTLLRMGAAVDAGPLRRTEQFVPVSANHGFALDLEPRFPKIPAAERASREADLLATLPARAVAGRILRYD